MLIEGSRSGGVDGEDLALAQRLDVADGGLAEEAAVLAAELADAFVADFVSGAGGVESIHEHALSRGLQAKLLLILERAHGGECAELMMEGGDSHARNRGELLHVERAGEVGAEPGYGSCGSVAEIARGGDGSEALSLWRAQDAVDNFPLYQWAEKGNVLWRVE